MSKKWPRGSMALLALLTVAGAASDRQTPDGTVLERASFTYPAYAALPQWMQEAYTPSAYDAYTISGPRLDRLKYRSDGLDVVAFVARPARSSARRLPVIVFNRGGIGENAKIGTANFHVIDELRRLAAEGYVVVASQYRGVDGIGGKDEVGGADLADIMNLLPMIRSFSDVDPERLFMMGVSRGGQMTLQALRRGFPARAGVVIGAPTDWEEAQRVSPRLAELARDSWPDYPTRHTEHARERSAVAWAAEIRAPVLIVHGGDDGAVPVSQALSLAQRMTDAGRPYELIVYAGDDHGVTRNRDDARARTLKWFRAHDTTQPTAATAAPIPVVARDFAFEMPETVHGGLVTFRFENRGREPHYMRYMRVASGKTADDVLTWRRSRTPAPPWLTPAGGIGTIAPGVSTDYTTRLEPGRYVALCGHPSPDGTPHVDKGMIREFAVASTLAGSAPTVTRTLELREYAFAFDARSLKGAVTWHVINRGSLMHQALLVRMPAGVSADAELAWFRGGSRGPRPGQPVGGVIELAPQGEAWFTAVLEPGNYVLLCGVSSSATDRHFDRGMVRHFTVG